MTDEYERHLPTPEELGIHTQPLPDEYGNCPAG